MTKKTGIKIIVVLLIFGMVGAIVAVAMYNKPHTNVATSKADVTLSAEALFADFESDEVAANTKYLDQIIQVTGPITAITTVKGNLIISLGNEDMFGSVKCHLTLEETEKKHPLKEGQMITVKGICTGYLMDVILVKAVLTN